MALSIFLSVPLLYQIALSSAIPLAITVVVSTITPDSVLSVINSSFTGNKSFGGSGYGGGISNDGTSTLTVTHSIFDGNVAGAFGGAIEDEGYLGIQNSTIKNNLTGDSGGGIYLFLTSYTAYGFCD